MKIGSKLIDKKCKARHILCSFEIVVSALCEFTY